MKTKVSIITIAFIAILAQACKHEPTTLLDATLYQESTEGSFTFWKGGAVLEGKGSSPHGDFKLKFNDIAQAALDANGELPKGESFPNGSIIVKDVYKRDKLDLIAIMKKDSSNSESAEGWLWAEYEPNGRVYFSVNKKGSGCTGCHGADPHRDYTQVFDLH